MSQIDLQFQPAPADLTHAVVGFAQRRDGIAWESGHELPMANPMLQFMLGGDYFVNDQAMPRAGLWGPTARPADSHTGGPAEVFMVVLTAAGATRIASSDMAQLINRVVDLTDIDARGWRGLHTQLAGAAAFERRIPIVTEQLRTLLADVSPEPTGVLAAADAILGHRFRGPVARIAAELGVTPRGLHKAFVREIGCGPKRLMRIARLQRLLRTLHPRPWSPGTPEDASLEYVDQAHLDRDFFDLTRLSRASYVAAKAARGDRLVHTVV